ncbi:MAG: MobH family relaxase [Steroidobacteraceae bacterium]
MFSLFRRKRSAPSPSTLAQHPAKGLLRPEPPAALLATPRRQRLLVHIWQRTAVSRDQFARLYRAPLDRYAALVQQFPASESHHHAYPGGMLDHGLEIVAYALKLRQAHLLPAGAPPENQASEAEAWTAGTAYAALLHDIGKIAVDIHVEYTDGSLWHPWHGPPTRAYRFRYRKDRAYRLHSAAAGLLYTNILDAPILDWLSGYPDLWSALLYVLAGQYEHAGILGELVVQADRASVAQDLGGDPAKVKDAPRQALQRKLLDGLRYLVREVLRLNQPEASDGWLTQDALWLVSKTVCDRLRAHLLSQGISGVPDRNTAVFDVLQEHGIVQATPDGKAIWRATVESETGWTHSFTFLCLAPSVIWEPSERPAPFRGTVYVDPSAEENRESGAVEAPAPPSTASLATSAPISIRSPVRADYPDAVGSVLALLDNTSGPPQLPAAIQATSGPPGFHPAPSPQSTGRDRFLPSAAAVDDASGARFVEWLCESVRAHRLVINDAKALVHTVAGTAFLVSPGVFQRYVQEHPPTARAAATERPGDWLWVQKQFEHLHYHRKHENGHNIWTCEVVGARKRRKLHGYLLVAPAKIFDEVPPDNPFLTLLSEDSSSKSNAA